MKKRISPSCAAESQVEIVSESYYNFIEESERFFAERKIGMSRDNEIKLGKFLEDALKKLKEENLEGFFDENRYWERISLKILNLAYGLELEDLNAVKKFYPAIDLGDSALKIGVQVTSSLTSEKIKNLSKLRNEVNGAPVFEKYNRIYLFIIGYKPGSFKEKQFAVPEDIRDLIEFDAAHIVDFEDFKKQFCGLSENLQDRILEILETDLCIRPGCALDAALNSNCNFVEGSREQEMKRLDEAFRCSKNVFLWGLGGIGKTELAVAWGRKKEKQGEYVYLVHYRGNIIDTVRDMEFSGFKYSKYSRAKDDQALRLEQFREKLDVLREYYGHATIIIDNFDRSDSVTTWTEMKNQQGYNDLIKLRTKFLFTTRFEVRESAVPVREMSMKDLLALFYQDEDELIRSADEKEVEKLIELVDRHTLTVNLMSKSIHFCSEGVTVEKLIQAFESGKLGERPLPRIDFAHNSENLDYEHREERILGHLKKLFEMSGLNDMQKNIMCHAFLLPESGIDIRRFCESHSDEEQDTLENVLIRRSWLRIDPGHTHISMHSVIHQVCAAELEPTDDNCSAFLVGLKAGILSTENQFVLKPVYDTIINAADILEDSSGQWNHLSGNYYRFMGRFEKAAVYLKKAADLAENNGEDLRKQAIIFNDTALNYARLDKYEEAIEYNKRALDLVKDTDDYLSAKIYHDMGDVYGFLAEKKRDRSLFDEALKCHDLSRSYNEKNTQDNKELAIASSIHNIGNIYANIGKTFRGPDEMVYYEKALENHREALLLREQIPDIPRRYLARSYNSLGNDYANLGDNEQAKSYRMLALEYMNTYLLDDHPEIAKQCSNIAHSYYQLKDYRSAVEFYEKAEKIWQKNLPQGRKNLAECQYNLMQSYWKKANKKEREDLLATKEHGEKALETAKSLRNSRLTKDILSSLAEVYKELGDRQGQQRLLEERRSLKKMKGTGGRNESRRIRNLAETAWKNKDFEKAEKYYGELLENEKKYTPGAHGNIMKTLYQLGLACQELRDYDHAESYFNQARDMCLEYDPDNIKLIKKYEKTISLLRATVKNRRTRSADSEYEQCE